MKLNPVLSALSLLLLSPRTSYVAAIPRPMDVYAPEILEPRNGETWVVGEQRQVVWDASTPPGQITNPYGVIKLRKGELTMDSKLAERFSILRGSMDIVVPNVTDGNDYRIVLFGDSGNWSPPFSIVRERCDHGHNRHRHD